MPAIHGACSGQIELDQVTALTLLYFDDTGEHPNEIQGVSALPEKRLSATMGDGVGEILVVGTEPGPALLTVSGVLGFAEDRQFAFEMEVRDERVPTVFGAGVDGFHTRDGFQLDLVEATETIPEIENSTRWPASCRWMRPLQPDAVDDN